MAWIDRTEGGKKAAWWCFTTLAGSLSRAFSREGGYRSKPRWRLGNKELSQLWKWADQNPNALTDPARVQTPSVTEYWKMLAEDMDESTGIGAEYHHKNNKVYCWKGLRFSARQDLEGFSRFTDHGIEGVVPPELLPPDVRSKYHSKPNSERSKRLKKEEDVKGNPHSEEPQFATVATEVDGGGSGPDVEDSGTPMDADTTAGIVSQSGAATPEECQKQSPDNIDIGPEMVQEMEPETEGEVGGVIDDLDQEPGPEPEFRAKR